MCVCPYVCACVCLSASTEKARSFNFRGEAASTKTEALEQRRGKIYIKKYKRTTAGEEKEKSTERLERGKKGACANKQNGAFAADAQMLSSWVILHVIHITYYIYDIIEQKLGFRARLHKQIKYSLKAPICRSFEANGSAQFQRRKQALLKLM